MNRLEKELINHEGIRLFPYKCSSGFLSIGVGRNIQQMGITKDEAMYMLRNDIERCRKELSNFDWFLDIDTVRQDVLIELCFNIGLTRLLLFKKMISALKKKDYDEASAQLLDSRWSTQVGPSRSSRMAHRLYNGKY